MKKVIVYIDGFNFYYGLKSNIKWRKYYWIDIVRLFEMFIRKDKDLVAVKYFSARPDSFEKSTNQNAFFQANSQNPKFELILGKYLKKEIKCYNCGYTIQTFEEKETDVRIATQIINDVYEKKCDISIVVSADSDMVPAIELAVKSGHEVSVFFPPFHYSGKLLSLSSCKPVYLEHYESRFKKCLMPDVVHLNSSNFDLKIPEKWKNYQDI